MDCPSGVDGGGTIGVEGVFTGVLELAMGSSLFFICFGNGAYLGASGEVATAPSTSTNSAARPANVSNRTILMLMWY